VDCKKLLAAVDTLGWTERIERDVWIEPEGYEPWNAYRALCGILPAERGFDEDDVWPFELEDMGSFRAVGNGTWVLRLK
jgi:hypothetical protein